MTSAKPVLLSWEWSRETSIEMLKYHSNNEQTWVTGFHFEEIHLFIVKKTKLWADFQSGLLPFFIYILNK